MHKFLPFAVLASFTIISPAEAKTTKCQLVVNGRIEMTGACEFESMKDGTDSFYAYDKDSTILPCCWPMKAEPMSIGAKAKAAPFRPSVK